MSDTPLFLAYFTRFELAAPFLGIALLVILSWIVAWLALRRVKRDDQ
jgi:hypothetical protein